MKKQYLGLLVLCAGLFVGGVWGVAVIKTYSLQSVFEKKKDAPTEKESFTMKMICTDDWSESNWYQTQEEKLYEVHNKDDKKVFYIGTYSSPKMEEVNKKWKVKRSAFMGTEEDRKCRLYFIMNEKTS